MNTKAFDFTDIKYIHPKIAAFSLLLTFFSALISPIKLVSAETVFIFVLILVQIEIFIALGRVMFKIDRGSTPKEITSSIVTRYLIYHTVCLFVAAIAFVAIMALLYLYKEIPLSNLMPNIIKYDFMGWFVSVNIGLAIGAFIFFLFQWQDALKREHQLKEEKLAFQFETLNNQVNPHFLFNSLNTLSSFISSKPDVAEKYVINLANIYRYIIDNAPNNQIELKKELDFIKDYFYLHQLRDEDKIELKLNVPNHEDYSIVPISLQILVENALKHNMASKSSPLIIEVYCEEDVIVVKNNLQKKTSFEDSPKKGLQNLDARMNLITGKGIDIIESRDEYVVEIPLIKNR